LPAKSKNNPFERIGERLLALFQIVGEMLRLLMETLLTCREAIRNFPGIVKQMGRIGADSLPIASIMALFIGMVLALQSGYALQKFGAESTYLGRTVALSIVRELGPVLTALLISGRVGASIAAELGTMSVSEEIDALRVLGINPVRYLAMPRFLACATMLPILVIYADVLGIIGGGVVAASVFGSTAKNYIDQVTIALDFMEIFKGLVKAFVFGGIIGIVSCHQGMNATGGAEGVGKATTETVVYSFIGIFVSNFFITRLWL